MGTSPAASEHCELLAERKILNDQARPRAEGRQQRADERLNNRIHVGDSPPNRSSVSPQNRTVPWDTLADGRLRAFASQSISLTTTSVLGLRFGRSATPQGG